MIKKALILAGGIGCGATLSQFPEFSQQYTQRLGGKVEELNLFIDNFDTDARKVGKTREQALVALAQSGEIGEVRAETMVNTMARRDRLANALVELKGASAYDRARMANMFTDSELARGTWQDFKPAVPLTAEGVVFTGGGFVLGAGAMMVLLGLLGRLFRRKKTSRA